MIRFTQEFFLSAATDGGAGQPIDAEPGADFSEQASPQIEEQDGSAAVILAQNKRAGEGAIGTMALILSREARAIEADSDKSLVA